MISCCFADWDVDGVGVGVVSGAENCASVVVSGEFGKYYWLGGRMKMCC